MDVKQHSSNFKKALDTKQNCSRLKETLHIIIWHRNNLALNATRDFERLLIIARCIWCEISHDSDTSSCSEWNLRSGVAIRRESPSDPATLSFHVSVNSIG